MHNTPNTQTTSRNKDDMDMLQRTLHQKQMELATFEYNEHNTTDLNTDIDPDNNFLAPIMNDCNYFTHEQYVNSVNPVGKLSIIHFNSRSMYKNFNSIKQYLQQFTHPFSIIAITETWLNIDKGTDFCLDDYELCYMKRGKKMGGGVVLYIHKSIQFTVLKEMTCAIDEIMECLTVEIHNKNKRNIIISCVYRSPGSNIECFSEWMEKLFSTVSQKTLIICGDFNIDLLNPNKLKIIDDFLDTMYSMSLYP